MKFKIAGVAAAIFGTVLSSGIAAADGSTQDEVRAQLAEALLLGSVVRAGFKWSSDGASANHPQSVDADTVGTSRESLRGSFTHNSWAATPRQPALIEAAAVPSQSAYKWGIR